MHRSCLITESFNFKMKFKIANIVFFLIVNMTCTIQNSFSQLEAKYWYFGYYCGLKFENDTPRVVTDGKMFTNMGSACISDKNGNLLFYSNGLTIWNKNHDTLKNGFGLYSSQSGNSVQGAIIIPLPGNPKLYYIFTISGNVRPNPGFWYHIVDMSKDNGKGEVILKNQYICGNVTERMSATFHANKKSVWIMVHEWNSNKFRAYLLKNTGLDTNAVISSVGTVHTGYIANNMGQLKFSASGKNMACVIWEDGIVDIFDFNNKTGMLSNCISINLGYSKAAFGTEFSPNEQLLYVSTNKPEGIYQIDLSSGIDSVIKNSGKYVYRESNPNTTWFFALQIGLDGKIYLARQHRELGCINNPNNIGSACNFVEKAITFPLATAAGLPTFLQSYFYLPDIVIKNTCLRDSTDFSLKDTINIDSVYWCFGDTGNSVTNYSSLYYPKHFYADTGYYKVTAIIYYNNQIDTFEREIRISNYAKANFSIADTTQCLDGNIFHFSDSSTAIDGSMTYEWDFGDSTKSFQQNPVKSYLLSDTFHVRLTVTSAYGCESNFYDTLIVYPKPKAYFSINDSTQCFNENSFIFYDSSIISSGILTYNWDFGDSQTINSSQKQVNYSYKNPDSHIYPVRLIAVSGQGCTDTIVKQVVIYPSPKSNFSINDSAQCLNKQNFVSTDLSTIIGDSITQIIWYWDTSTLVNQPTISFNNLQTGTLNIKLITLTKHGCPDTIEKQLIVQPLPKADFSINDSAQCFNQQNFSITNKSTISSGNLVSTWHIANDSFATTNLQLSNLTTVDHNLKLKTISDLNCADSITKTLIVQPSPSASFVVNDSAQCLNSNSFDFTNTSVIQSGSMTYKWIVDSKSFQTASIPSFYFTKWGKYPIRLVSTSNNDCSDSSESNAYVFPNPISAFVYLNNCIEDTMWFFDKSNSDSGSIQQWFWDFRNGKTSSLKNPYTVYSDTGHKSVTLVSTNDFGCSHTSTKFFKIETHVSTPELERATVENDEFVLVEWNSPKEGIPMTYHLEKSTDSIIWNPVSDFDNKTFNYNDLNTKVDLKNYYYRINVTDSCNYTSPYSNIGKTILLNIDTSGQFPIVTWSPYEFWASGIESYGLQIASYSKSDNAKTKNFIPIGSYAQPENVRDSISKLLGENYCYRLIAFRKPDQLISVSNEICIPAISHLFIPNAFSPNNDGLNDVFKPFGMHILDYNLQVFNRWGEKMFESNDISSGWDGKFKGAECIMETYFYQVSAMGTNSRHFNKMGSVLLMR